MHISNQIRCTTQADPAIKQAHVTKSRTESMDQVLKKASDELRFRGSDEYSENE